MKKMIRAFVLALGLLATTQAFAQIVPTWEKGDLEKKGGSLAVKGQTLDKETTLALLKAAGGAQMAEDWASAVSKRGLGIGLTAGGFGVAAVGGALSLAGAFGGTIIGGMFGGQEGAEKGANNGLTTGGLIAAGAGLAAGIIGIVQLTSGNSKLNDIVDRCNTQGPANHSAALTVGATPSGVGLALRF